MILMLVGMYIQDFQDVRASTSITGICNLDYFNAISHASQFEVGKGIAALPCCDMLCRGTFLVFQLAPTLRVAKVTLEAAPTVGLGGAEKTEGLVTNVTKTVWA